MALSALGRKHLLPHGAQRKIARALDIEQSRVSVVIAGLDIPKTELGWKSYRRVQRAVAKALDLRVDEAFSAVERGEVEELAAAS